MRLLTQLPLARLRPLGRGLAVEHPKDEERGEIRRANLLKVSLERRVSLWAELSGAGHSKAAVGLVEGWCGPMMGASVY